MLDIGSIAGTAFETDIIISQQEGILNARVDICIRM